MDFFTIIDILFVIVMLVLIYINIKEKKYLSAVLLAIAMILSIISLVKKFM